jgi:pimeloyl-ACP methyl ester carboxylesterase
VTGEGTPLVWVHEYGGDLRSWEPQVRYVARRYRVIAYNQRGYPPSTVPTAARDYALAFPTVWGEGGGRMPDGRA